MPHGKVCPCPNCRGPAACLGWGIVVACLVSVVCVHWWVWLAAVLGVCAAVAAVLAAGVAVLARRAAPFSVSAWDGKHRPAGLTSARVQRALEVVPERLAVEAPKVVLDGVVVSETNERMPS